jgi:serine/threonine-protein kinase
METRAPSEGGHPTFAPVTCASCGGLFTPQVASQTLCDKCQGLAHPEPPPSPLQQVEVAGYKLKHELGQGRFSTSWLAEDPQGRAAVLKLLRRYAPDPNSVQRFLAEAQRLALAPELDHPNIARLSTAGVHLVSALVLIYQSGGELTLADELRARGRVMAPRALEFCAQICEGLASMHRGGIFHLDLKPANVGLTRLKDGTEQAVLLDAGTAHLLGKVGLRYAGALPLSSAAYMSPEEAAGKPVDGRSDLYSVGVLLFQLLSGRLPFMGGTSDELLAAHREHPPLRLRDVGRRVNDDLEELLAQLLAKDPAQRLWSGDELALMLRALAPIADTALMEDGPESSDDPVPVVAPQRPEPEVASTPLLEPLDPDLERAMMGHVAAPAPSRAPGIPNWAPFVLPAWWPRAATAAAIALALLLGGIAIVRSKNNPRRPLAGPGAAGTAKPEPEPELKPEPGRGSGPGPKLAQAFPPSRYKSNFDRAQKAIWTGKPSVAQPILRDLLRKSRLPRPDKARASKMMGDIEAKKGNKSAAVDWYRKSLRLQDDSAERERVVKLMQALK